MMSITDTVKRSKWAHSLYKLARDYRQVPSSRWFRGPQMYAVVRALPNTMLPMPRLFDAYDAIRVVDAEGIPGDVVECGVWNGGCVGVMALAHEHGKPATGRTFHLFDSFEGLPQPTEKDVDVVNDFRAQNPDAEIKESGADNLVAIGACAGDNKPAVEKFLVGTLGIDRDWLNFHVGWFQDTVPNSQAIGQIAVLRLDGDWYDSTKVCLEGFYDRVVENGFIIIDDYGCFAGCRDAVDEFMAARGLKPEMTYSDHHCVYFRKTTPEA
jgi:O-methyltransferase